MMDWNMVIRGVGPDDANAEVAALARQFVAKLEAAGHIVRAAQLTPGEIDLTVAPPAEPQAEK